MTFNLNKINFTGKIIIDYPYNKEWNEPYSGVHFKSKYINKFERLSNNHILASASCHTIAEIEQCNKKLFDFILVSPVIHAHDNKKPLGWEKFNKYSSISLSPCLALGGISKFNEDYKNAISQQGFGIAGISKV